MAGPIPIGMCLSPDQYPDLAPSYDYLEVTVSGALNPLQTDEEFAPQLERLQAMEPPIRAFNNFVPGSIKLTGPDVDWEAAERYVATAAQRAHDLGGEIIVFGSGGARNVPDGFSRTEAWAQLVRFCRLCADRFEGTGLTLAIEPLNHTESNIINTYLEGVRLARDVDRDRVKVLADIYHFMMDDEPLDDILEAPEWLAHVHLADSGRRNPGSGEYPLGRWFEILHEIGYQGRASVECRWGEDYRRETADSLAFLRQLA